MSSRMIDAVRFMFQMSNSCSVLGWVARQMEFGAWSRSIRKRSPARRTDVLAVREGWLEVNDDLVSDSPFLWNG
jgi:hypothetical protein